MTIETQLLKTIGDFALPDIAEHQVLLFESVKAIHIHVDYAMTADSSANPPHISAFIHI